MTGEEHETGGSYALAGYDYQIDVSIWLALDLLLGSKLTRELVLEPASQEDLEAELEEYEPSRITNTAQLDGYTLVVQAKLRTGDAWTVSKFQKLLVHGSEGRQSAAERLSAYDTRYLLVTSAGLNGKTRGLKIRRAGAWPKPADMPVSIARSLPSDAAGRVAVIGNQDEERLATDIRRILTESFRVPNACWRACLKVLREEAHIRIRHGGSGYWRRDELQSVIRNHQGYIASSPELEHYVHPINWKDLRAAMRERHAALIIGQSGTGKTMATRKLYEELQEDIPGLAHVPITLGPNQLSNDRTDSPVLYDIVDPWGRFNFDPTSRPWNDQLAQFFAHTTHDRLIVATSRLDVAQSSGALEAVEHWMIALEAEHYGKAERQQLYQSRIEALPRDLQNAATQAMTTVLSKLGTPLEIQKFFDALPTIDREYLKNPHRLISEAIRQAHQNSIERTVIEQIEQRNDVRAAAIIWGLLKATDKLSLQVVRTIEERLADRDTAMSDGVTPLITFFVAARNLRQIEYIVTYYHPRVESGIEQTLARHKLVVRGMLRLLIEVLTSLDGQGEEWGVTAAAKLLAATDRITDLKPVPTAGSAAIIDAWLATQLTRSGREFEANLRLASVAGSTDSNVSEVARYLLNQEGWRFLGESQWGPPEQDEAWYERLRCDPTTKPLVETFIRDILPTERNHFPRSFATEIERLVPDISGAFLEAATLAVGFGFSESAITIAEGALQNLKGFEAIVDAAVEALSPSGEGRREAEKTHLAIVNGEYSGAYAEYLAENDDYYTAMEFLRAYVGRVRAMDGWRNLAKHQHRDQLVFYWLRDLAEEAKRVTLDSDEVTGAFMVSYKGKHEDCLWFMILQAWDPRYLDALTKRVTVGHAARAVRQAAIACLVEHAPEELAKIGRSLIANDDINRLVEIAIDLANLRNGRMSYAKRHECAASSALATLPSAFKELSDADLALAEGKHFVLSAQARAILEDTRGGGVDLRRFRVSLDTSLQIEDDVRWLLANADEAGIVVKALEAAIRRGMITDVEAALDHKFADVSARALTVLGAPIPAPFPDRFLAKSKVKGSPVRKALVALLETKPHVTHLPTLLRLARDTWSPASRYLGENDNFPIAQAAVAAIGKMPQLSSDISERLYDIAIETSAPDLRSAIFQLLATNAGLAYQDHLFDLAVSPGTLAVKRAAAVALLQASNDVSSKVVTRVTPELLATQVPPVAVNLTLLFAWRAEIRAVRHAAEFLAPHAKRRVLLLLLIRVVKDRDSEAAQTLAAMLPADHVGVAWALGAEIETLNDGLLADLGDPAICAQVLVCMKQS